MFETVLNIFNGTSKGIQYYLLFIYLFLGSTLVEKHPDLTEKFFLTYEKIEINNKSYTRTQSRLIGFTDPECRF